MHIEYTVQVWKEGTQYIAHAMPLDVVSSGPTPEGAKNALKEAVHLFIDTVKEMGTLDEVLNECGYESKGNKWVSPPWIAIERQSMAIEI
jgi:predicted RNase H-like HicB family nuclease